MAAKGQRWGSSIAYGTTILKFSIMIGVKQWILTDNYITKWKYGSWNKKEIKYYWQYNG